jgi:tripartite-type tricarboxylate transporter receptor subunit TctC
VISPSVMSKLPYDVTKDFAGITILGVVPNVLVIAPSQKINTVKEFVSAMKKRSGGMIYAAIVGTITHLNGEHFKKTMGIEGRMVPFKGAPAALTEVMAARVDVYFSPVLPALALLNDKKLVPLAVMGPKRVPLLPDVPTGLEAGYPESLFGLWLGMYAPAKTPRPIIDKLYAETAKALERKEVKEKLTKMGVDQNPMPPDKFDAYVKAQVKQGEELAKLAGVYRSK